MTCLNLCLNLKKKQKQCMKNSFNDIQDLQSVFFLDARFLLAEPEQDTDFPERQLLQVSAGRSMLRVLIKNRIRWRRGC